jgi:hypothetical protein
MNASVREAFRASHGKEVGKVIAGNLYDLNGRFISGLALLDSEGHDAEVPESLKSLLAL